jgi:ubiquinone/menaquinone biosynthesis C-methylase UbiE
MASPVKKKPARSGKPDYDPTQSAYHLAFAPELEQIVDQLPLTRGMRVLDVPCGNGFYSRLLAERLGATGQIDCVDLCRPYLTSTRRRLRGFRCEHEVHEANAYQLPFADNTFDLVWCAQSLISLKDRAAAVAEMTRVLRPGGALAILENDFFHEVLLPWPADLEAPVQRAIQLNYRAKFGSSSKLTPVRRLPQILDDAGLVNRTRRTFAADRQSPWPASVRRFLEHHLAELHCLIGQRLSPHSRAAFERFADPSHPSSVFGAKAMDLTCLNVLYRAEKPG